MNSLNLLGKIFGRLTVIERGPSVVTSKSKPAQWYCRCVCGNITLVRSNNLIRGHTTSCGCLRREIHSKKLIEKTAPPNETILATFIRTYKINAKRRNLCFTLTNGEAITLALSNCIYCGIPPCRQIKLYARKKTPQGDLLVNGIDRKDNNLGYTKENCVACCRICNQAKHTLTEKEWLDYMDRLVKFRTKK